MNDLEHVDEMAPSQWLDRIPPFESHATLSDAAQDPQFIMAGNLREFPITPCAAWFDFFPPHVWFIPF